MRRRRGVVAAALLSYVMVINTKPFSREVTLRCPTTAPSFHPLGDKPAPGNHHISDAPKSESASPNDPVCHLVIVLSHSQFPKRHVTAPDLNSFLGVMVRSRNSERHKRVIWFPLPINITAETQPSHTHPEPQQSGNVLSSLILAAAPL